MRCQSAGLDRQAVPSGFWLLGGPSVLFVLCPRELTLTGKDLMTFERTFISLGNGSSEQGQAGCP